MPRYEIEASHASGPSPGPATASDRDLAPPIYGALSGETRALLGLPREPSSPASTRRGLRVRRDGTSSLAVSHQRCAKLPLADRALQMSAALLEVPMETKRGGVDDLTREVGLQWDIEASEDFLDQIHRDLLNLQARSDEAAHGVVTSLLHAWPLFRDCGLALKLAVHPVFERVMDCLEAAPDTWVTHLSAREPDWLERAAEFAGDLIDDPWREWSRLAERVKSALSRLAPPRDLHAMATLAAARLRLAAACDPDETLLAALHAQVRHDTDRAKAGRCDELTPGGWGALACAWGALAACEKEPLDRARITEIVGALDGIIQKLKAGKSLHALLEVGIALLSIVRPEPRMTASIQLLLLHRMESLVKALWIQSDDSAQIDLPRLLELQRRLGDIPKLGESSMREKARRTVEDHVRYFVEWNLMDAAQAGDTERLACLRREGFKLSPPISAGVAEDFGKAVRRDRLDQVATLLDFGLPADVPVDASGIHGVHMVRSVGMLDILIGRNATVLCRDPDGRLPSELARDEETRARLRSLESKATESSSGSA